MIKLVVRVIRRIKKNRKSLKRMKFQEIVRSRIVRRLVTHFVLKVVVSSCLKISLVYASGDRVDKVIVTIGNWLHNTLYYASMTGHDAIQNLQDISLFSVMLVEEVILKSDFGLTYGSILAAEQINYLTQREKYTYCYLFMATYFDLRPQTIPTTNESLRILLPHIGVYSEKCTFSLYRNRYSELWAYWI